MTRQALAFLGMALVPAYVYAVDGQVLINQAAVNAAGGFPYVISQPGSYKLSGNLIIADKTKTAIEITTNNVTIDLNGFAIIGPADCTGGFPCINASDTHSGLGITTRQLNPQNYFDITIRNGSIQGMGGSAIDLNGDSIVIEQMHIYSNGSSGIIVQMVSENPLSVRISQNTVERNGNYGIVLRGGICSDNVVSHNFADGILVNFGTAARNTSMSNAGRGMNLGSVGYSGNTLVNNGPGGTFNVSGGVNQGQNLCGGATCP